MYRPGKFQYNIGIIVIDEGMTIDGITTDTIPVENSSSEFGPGDIVAITGWGATEVRH